MGLLVVIGVLFVSRFHAAGVPGDVNGDGKVDILDLSIMASHWGQSGMTLAQGDLSGDGKVDIFDLSILGSNWGNGPVLTHTCHAGDPLYGVLNPSRLSVTNLCQTITGKVCQLEFSETDGDNSFDVLVDTQYLSLLRSQNINQCAPVDSRLALHLETIPQNQAGTVFQSPNTATLALKVGDYISVTGPLVQDIGHGGWTEIHPVEFIDVITHSTVAQPAASTRAVLKEP